MFQFIPFQSYPVKDIAREPLGNSLSNTKGFGSILRLIWNQTRAIFIHPHLANTLKLGYIIFCMFLFGHGMVNWVPDFLMRLQRNIGSGKTLCEIIDYSISDESLVEEYEHPSASEQKNGINIIIDVWPLFQMQY